MTDILTPAQRSALMAKVKGWGNASTELRLVAVFRALGITGWRRKAAVLGKPDFVFPQLRIAVFVDGCFWHGCPIHATQPKQNAEFWAEKIAKNRARDLLVTRTLRRAGWRVLRLWEHELTRKYEKRLLARLRRAGVLPPRSASFEASPGEAESVQRRRRRVSASAAAPRPPKRAAADGSGIATRSR